MPLRSATAAAKLLERVLDQAEVCISYHIGQIARPSQLFCGLLCSLGVGMQASVLSAPAAGLLMPQQLVDMPTSSLMPSVALELKGNPESTSSGEQLIEAVHAGRKNQQMRLQGKWARGTQTELHTDSLADWNLKFHI